MCPVHGCTSTFESNEELDVHIAANLHKVTPPIPRTANDIARYHLVDTVRSINVQYQYDTDAVHQKHATSNFDTTNSVHYHYFTSLGWSLRTRKHNNPICEKTKKFIEDKWVDSQKTLSKLTPEAIQQQIRSQRDNNNKKLFEPHEYATINQIKYRFRKIAAKYEVIAKEELISELMEDNTE